MWTRRVANSVRASPYLSHVGVSGRSSTYTANFSRARVDRITLPRTQCIFNCNCNYRRRYYDWQQWKARTGCKRVISMHEVNTQHVAINDCAKTEAIASPAWISACPWSVVDRASDRARPRSIARRPRASWITS